ncbi:alpha/beta hydrolase [Caballeronia sp. dw_276]|uniref:alpha/beta fold hydrolase n=1 Tax=Caballeronia sp. dw_276 TaxID=2719795 RepID=UPI001BD523C0|nr:alpha/beta hydrolase [Caballeronia sp. dw_276]
MTLGVTEWHEQEPVRRSRPPIVFLHGMGDAASVWLGIAPFLCDRFRVLGIDLRGHGESDWSVRQDYRIASYVADVEALLDVLGLDRVSLVGHSLGGAVSIRYATKHPEQIHSMIIVDHGPDTAASSADHICKAIRDACRIYGDVDDYATVLRERHPLGEADLLKRIAATMMRRAANGGFELKHDPAVIADSGPSATSDERLDDNAWTWQSLAALRTRTAIIRGVASSVLSAAVAKRMLELTGGDVTLETIPMAGHSIHLDNAVKLREAILRFFA